MRERAEELGGRLELETAVEGGTRIAALLPCPEVA
jgi:signal transduction histidine kinase